MHKQAEEPSRVLFSIITICRNDLEGLKATANSVMKQSNRNYEWIVIDGDSEDGSQQWLDDCFHANGSWFSEKDGGIYDAMNKGISRSTGSYLIFMNAGDRFADDAVLEQVGVAVERDHPVFVYGDSIDVRPDGSELYLTSRSVDHIPRGMMTQHQATFYHHDFFKTWIYPERYRLSGDYALFCQVYRHVPAEQYLYLPVPICRYALGGAHDVNRLQGIQEDFHIRREILGLNYVYCVLLFMAHYLLHLLKRLSPGMMMILRYNKPDANQ